MRRSAQIISGHNYYRKANEILQIDQQKVGSFGVLDEIKSIPDGVSILGMPGFRVRAGISSALSQQIVTSHGGFILKRPTVAIGSEIVIQPNVAFTGNFNFEFDITHPFEGAVWWNTFVGTTYDIGFYFYFGAPLVTAYYLKLRIIYGEYTRFAFVTQAMGGTSGYFEPYYSKFKFVRSGNLVAFYGYRSDTSAWVAIISNLSLAASTAYFMFKYTTLDNSNYAQIEYKNFVLNAGQTQILW